MRKVSRKQLIATQMEHWPNSVILDVHDMFRWCDEPKTDTGRLRRYMQISMALQYPTVIYYRIEGDAGYRGIRYGTHGAQYMSLYSGE